LSKINALIGSRICHDLINPLGAIGNGVELLGLSGVNASPELAMVTEAVENATAKVKFMRLAFGDASPDQVVSRKEILTTLEQVASGGRLNYAWHVTDDASRLDVRVALLAVMCVETALPLGGTIEIRMKDGKWAVYAKHERMNLDPALWVPLSKAVEPDPLAAAQVHFALLPGMAQQAGRQLNLTHGADWVNIGF